LRDAGLDEHHIAIQYKNRKYVQDTQNAEVDLDLFFATSDPQKLLALYREELFNSIDSLWSHTIVANVQRHMLDHLEQAIQQAKNEGNIERIEYYQLRLGELQS
jgi:hypothetical protein